MYTIKIVFKELIFNHDEQKAIITFFLAKKDANFSYYPIFDESEYIQSVHGDINVWVVDADSQEVSDEKKYIIKYINFENLIERFEKLSLDVKEVFDESQKQELEKSQKREIVPISKDIKDSVSNMLIYFITNQENGELLENIKNDSNFNELEKLFDVLSHSKIKAEILETILKHIDEVDLDEFFDIINHHASLSKKFNVASAGGDGSLEMNVGGQLATIADNSKAKAQMKSSTSIASLNPFVGLFK